MAYGIKLPPVMAFQCLLVRIVAAQLLIWFSAASLGKPQGSCTPVGGPDIALGFCLHPA